MPKYRVPIQNVLTDWAENDELLIAMANAALADRRGDTPENCRADLLRKIYWIQECYDNLERDYLDEIDAQVRRYTRAATQKIENLTNRDQNIRGNLPHGADRAVAQPASRRSGGHDSAGVPAV